MTQTPPNDSTAPENAAAPQGSTAQEGVPLSPETRESLIEYPSAFPIKVVGLNEDGFVSAITHIAKQFDPQFDAAGVELRESGGGKYLGVTITVTATSREQLDELYKTLTAQPLVKWVL